MLSRGPWSSGAGAAHARSARSWAPTSLEAASAGLPAPEPEAGFRQAACATVERARRLRVDGVPCEASPLPFASAATGARRLAPPTFAAAPSHSRHPCLTATPSQSRHSFSRAALQSRHPLTSPRRPSQSRSLMPEHHQRVGLCRATGRQEGGCNTPGEHGQRHQGQRAGVDRRHVEVDALSR